MKTGTKESWLCCWLTSKTRGKLKYTWLQDEKELREQHQQTLTIKKAKQDTGGAYQCCVSNPFGEVKSEIIKITVGE